MRAITTQAPNSARLRARAGSGEASLRSRTGLRPTEDMSTAMQTIALEKMGYEANSAAVTMLVGKGDAACSTMLTWVDPSHAASVAAITFAALPPSVAAMP